MEQQAACAARLAELIDLGQRMQAVQQLMVVTEDDLVFVCSNEVQQILASTGSLRLADLVCALASDLIKLRKAARSRGDDLNMEGNLHEE